MQFVCKTVHMYCINTWRSLYSSKSPGNIDTDENIFDFSFVVIKGGNTSESDIDNGDLGDLALEVELADFPDFDGQAQSCRGRRSRGLAEASTIVLELTLNREPYWFRSSLDFPFPHLSVTTT